MIRHNRTEGHQGHQMPPPPLPPRNVDRRACVVDSLQGSSLPSSAGMTSLQSSVLDFHNLSQDSGISPSPHFDINNRSNFAQSPNNVDHLGRVRWKFNGHPDGMIIPNGLGSIGGTPVSRNPGLAPISNPAANSNPAGNSNLSLAGNSNSNPLPLPPRSSSVQQQPRPHTNVFTPTMRVKSPAETASSECSWKSRAKQRAEERRLRRNSARSMMATAAAVANEVHNESSSEDNYNNAAAMEDSLSTASTFRALHVIPHPSDLGIPTQDVRPNSQSSNNPPPPPPPPPRDPRRRLYLLRGQDGRPVSYSFENSCSSSPQGVKPGKPTPFSGRSHHSQLSSSDLHLNSHEEFRTPMRGRVDSVDNRYSSQPSLLVTRPSPPLPMSPMLTTPTNPSGEYWKSPPPLSATPLHAYEKAEFVFIENPIPSPRLKSRQGLRKKLSNADSLLHSGSSSITTEKSGKSSPSNSSISSKDSGCSTDLASSKRNSSAASSSRPLSAVTEERERAAAAAIAEEPVKEHSPPRSFADDPGFSTKARRCHFRDALNELEDAVQSIGMDTDLLDRAERRDLPTAHQELIAQAREKFSAATTDNDNSVKTEDEGSNEDSVAFSDMDNFMNWNTSSSFENLAPPTLPVTSRSRTPANRRSAVVNKTEDDVVFRICRDNNRTRSASVVSRNDHSYIHLFPDDTSSNKGGKKDQDRGKGRRRDSLEDEEEGAEPDTVTDDLVFRTIRDANSASILANKFGVPKEVYPGCSERSDYLHAVPERGRYKSTFNAMKNPDTVMDDVAFRSLRRDGKLSEPERLGIVKDPRLPSETTSSCWLHKRMEAEYKRDDPNEGPCVFYPKRNQALLTSLSEHIAQIIKKQSGSAGGGDDDRIVTYEDLRDPKVAEAMQYTLGIIAGGDDVKDCDKKGSDEVGTGDEEDDPKDWSGKNVFELLSTNIVDLLDKRKKGASGVQELENLPATPTQVHDGTPAVTPEVTPSEDCDNNKEGDERDIQNGQPEVIVQHCILEQDLAAFNRTLSKQLKMVNGDHGKKEKANLTICDTIDNSRELELGVERSESSCSVRLEEGDCDPEADDPPVEILEKSPSKEEGEPSTSGVPDSQTALPKSGDQPETQTSKGPGTPSQTRPETPTSLACLMREEPGSGSPLLTLPHSLVVILCYALAVAHQFSGLDFLSALGILCAAVSMVSMWFL